MIASGEKLLTSEQRVGHTQKQIHDGIYHSNVQMQLRLVEVKQPVSRREDFPSDSRPPVSAVDRSSDDLFRQAADRM
jgi:hypothetical protein